MNCPKCNHPIKETDLNCPGCKKVLKLKCPRCSTVTHNRICPECDYIILTKCFKCGKLNPTNITNCPKCGMNVVASIALNESSLNEFAVLCVEFHNFETIKKAFDARMMKQFREGIYELIKNLAIKNKIRTQLVDNVIIMRFNRESNPKKSCLAAMNFALNISKSINDINTKLFEKKHIAIKAKMSISKGDMFSKKTNYGIGRNIDVLNVFEKKRTLLSNIQIIVDGFVHKSLEHKFPFQSFSSVLFEDEILMFYELLINNVLKIETLPKHGTFTEIVSTDRNNYLEEDNDLKIINFTEKNSSFLNVKQDDVLHSINLILDSSVRNPIIVLKEHTTLGKSLDLNNELFFENVNNYFSIGVCCTKLDKYKPFGLFREVIKAFYGLNEFDILSNPKIVQDLKMNEYLKSILLLNPINKYSPEDARFKVFSVAKDFFKSIKNTLLVIEDVHNIDEGSLDLIRYLIAENALGQTALLMSCNEHFYLHNEIYQLISCKNFFELKLISSPINEITEKYKRQVKDIKSSFYYQKIINNTKGSTFYFNQALNYLVDKEVLNFDEDHYQIYKDKIVIIPNSIFELIEKRLDNLAEDESLFEFYASMLMLDSEVPLDLAMLLNNEDPKLNLIKLQKSGLITLTKEKTIRLNYYNQYQESLLSCIDKYKINKILFNLIKKLLPRMQSTHPTFARYFESIGERKQAFNIWNTLSEINASSGDFAAYVECVEKYLGLIDNSIDDIFDSYADSIKFEAYEQMSDLLYKYYPSKIFIFLDKLLKNAEIRKDDKKIEYFSNLMIQSCLLSGNYTKAFEYICKINERTPIHQFDPMHKDFSLTCYLTNFVAIEIYYNVGRLDECIELGDELMLFVDVSDIKNILPRDFSPKKLKDAIKDTRLFLSIARVLQLKPDTEEKIQDMISLYPDEAFVFEILLLINKFLKGNLEENNSEYLKYQQAFKSMDSYSKALFYLFEVLMSFNKKNWVEMGNTAHQGRYFSKENNLFQFTELFDLVIGFAYKNLNSYKKASHIYSSVLKTSSEQGLKNITYFCWYLIADLEISQNNVDTAMDVLNNAIFIENNDNGSRLIVVMLKLLLAKALFSRNENNKALYLANNVFNAASQSGLSRYLPDCKKLLVSVYESLVKTETDERLIQQYENKIDELSNKHEL